MHLHQGGSIFTILPAARTTLHLHQGGSILPAAQTTRYPHQALKGGYFVFVWGVGTGLDLPDLRSAPLCLCPNRSQCRRNTSHSNLKSKKCELRTASGTRECEQRTNNARAAYEQRTNNARAAYANSYEQRANYERELTRELRDAPLWIDVDIDI